ALGRLADQPLAVLGEGDHRRGGAGALGVLDDLGLLAFHDGNAGVRRAEVDADNLAHVFPHSLRQAAAAIACAHHGPLGATSPHGTRVIYGARHPPASRRACDLGAACAAAAPPYARADPAAEDRPCAPPPCPCSPCCWRCSPPPRRPRTCAS